jgi:hypothetical protein
MVLRIILLVLAWCALLMPCRRVPQASSDHSRFSFAAPPELTSIQVNTPTYQLPELPAPDRPLLVPKQQQSAALPLLVSLNCWRGFPDVLMTALLRCRCFGAGRSHCL